MTKFVHDPAQAYAAPMPERLDTPIWRYQDLAKLVWTLSTSTLWFSRADRLGDPFEGSTTRHAQKQITSSLNGTLAIHVLTDMAKVGRAMVRNTGVNCWHMSDHESAAMWRLYAPTGQGVAIRSTVQRILRSLPRGTVKGAGRDLHGVANVLDVQCGAVQYIDHFDEKPSGVSLPSPALVTPFFRKGKSFEHEREFRAVVQDVPVRLDTLDWDNSAFPEGGASVPVDLGVLIEAVYVSPNAPPWFRVAVEAIRDRSSLSFPVRQSDMDKDPIF